MKGNFKIGIFIVMMAAVALAYFQIYSGKEITKSGNIAAADRITITDSKSRQVEVPCPPKRIAGIGGSYGLEALLAFGVRDEIVAMADYAKKREDFRLFVPDVPDVGGSSKPNIEEILTVNPDLVLAYAIYSFPEMEQVLAARRIPLVQLDFFIPETYAQEVRTLGKILHREMRAEELINFETKQLACIANRVQHIKPEEKVSVYLESYQAYQATSQQDQSHDPILGCGGINIFAGEPVKNPVVSAEAVVMRNPDVIIKIMNGQYCLSGYGVTNPAALASLRKEIMNRPGWQQINAVKNGRVYIISTDTHSIHPSIYYSYLAKWFYPENFADLNPASIHQAWLKQFLGMELNGVYAYPDK